MDWRPLILPALTGAMAVTVTLGRLNPIVASIAAIFGLACMALYPLFPRRKLLLFGIVGPASYVAGQLPWKGMASAVVIAGALAMIIGGLPRFERARDSAIPMTAGIVAGVVTGLLARQSGLMTGFGDGLAIVVVLIAFRAGTVALGAKHWLTTIAFSIQSVPHLGPYGLLLAASETSFGLAMLGTPSKHRVAFLFGAPLALVGLV